MKIYELKKGDRFEIVIDGQTIMATFYGMDGMFAKVVFDGIEEMQKLHCGVEVELI